MTNNRCQVDMHIHTTASDGTWSAEELLQHIIDKGISIFSITDHDRIHNSVKMLELVPDHIEYHIGAEISCTYRDREYHITAYDFDSTDKGLTELIRDNLERRLAYNTRIVRYAKATGKIVDMEDYKGYQYDGSRGGWNSLNYLIDKGVVSNMAEYFQLIKASKEVLSFRDPQEVIDTIKNAGGYAILAHPSAYHNGEKLDIEIMEEWIGYGISGIECYSPYLANIEDADYYVRFCRDNKIMISAGSDCHGEFNGRTLGIPEVYIDQVQLDFIKTT